MNARSSLATNGHYGQHQTPVTQLESLDLYALNRAIDRFVNAQIQSRARTSRVKQQTDLRQEYSSMLHHISDKAVFGDESSNPAVSFARYHIVARNVDTDEVISRGEAHFSYAGTSANFTAELRDDSGTVISLNGAEENGLLSLNFSGSLASSSTLPLCRIPVLLSSNLGNGEFDILVLSLSRSDTAMLAVETPLLLEFRNRCWYMAPHQIL